MDDEKKYTTENELENDNKNRMDEFDEFNFTDDFPDEFSEEFMKKTPNEQQNAVEEPSSPEIDFDDDFAPKQNTFDKDDTFDNDDPFKDDTFKDDEFKVDEFKDDEFKDNAFDSDDLDDLNSQNNIPPVTPPPEQRKGNLLKRHPVLTSVIFLVMLFGGYKWMQSSGSGEITPVPGNKTAQTKSLEHLPATKGGVEIRQIDERLDMIEQGMNVMNDQLTQLQGAHTRIEQMEQMVTKIAEEERGLSAILLRLEALNKQVSALTSLDQRLNSLEAQVGVIASEVELHITVSEQTQRAANLSRQAMQAKSLIPVPMVVQAAIPGRAWLLSQTGELLTVARGDDVPGYGRVMNIDPVAGTVTMSSETVFREEE